MAAERNRSFSVTTVDGDLKRYRQPAFKNEFNPEGITLESIRKELAPKYYEQLRRIERSNASMVARLGAISREGLYDSPDFMIQPQDEEFARFLGENPIAIVAAAEVAPTIARWMYSMYHSSIPTIKTHGRKMLELVNHTSRGRSKISPFSDASLRIAYEDAKRYGEAVGACIESTKEPELVAKSFPDSGLLRELGFDIAGICKGRLQKLTPSDFAVAFLKRHTGMSRTLLMDRIRSAKPS